MEARITSTDEKDLEERDNAPACNDTESMNSACLG